MSHAFRELLEFYTASGVDCGLEDAPQDRFAESAASNRQRSKKAKDPDAQQPVGATAGETSNSGNFSRDRVNISTSGMQEFEPRPIQKAARIPNDEIVAQARTVAAAANSLQDLQSALSSFEGCNLKKYAKSTVFADGNSEASIMLVGDASGRDEDISGLPFSGSTGQLLDKMLGAIGIDRSSAYFANIIPWRPPGNRAPTPAETSICRPFIERQIELVDPDILVPVGEVAAKVLLGKTENIVKLRGRWATYKCNDRDMLAMPIFHPEYLLLQPAQKRLAWQDLLTIKRKLAEVSVTS